MSRSQGLERFLGCLNGWTCESALPLDLERDAWYVHHRVAVQLTLPLGPERTDCTAIWHRSYRFGTLTPVWQSRPHCHSALSVPRPHPFIATRHRTYRSHCHSTLNATCGTFTIDWQCELHCHSAPSVPRPHPFTATRHRSYRFGTLTPVWQSRPHCHSAPSVPRHHPFTATRP